MARIEPVTIETAPEESRPVLEAIQAQFGKVPNIFATLAKSPAALKTLMGIFGSLDAGKLAGIPHEALALCVGERHGCKYCTAAHTAKAKMAGATDEQAIGFRKCQADDPKIQALINLAMQVVEKRGQISDADIQAAKDAGITEGEMLELLAIVVCNTYTNYINAMAQTTVDFPPAPELS